jgi:hypothetical protein
MFLSLGAVAIAILPIVLIPSGITREVRFPVVRIELAPIEVRLVGVSNVSEVIPEVQKAPSILVTLFGITTEICPVP